MAQTFESIMKYPTATDEEIKVAMNKCVEIVRKNLADFTDMFPAHATKNNIYPRTPNEDWTEGFWSGQVWLAYEMTHDEEFKKTGEAHIKSFLHRIENKIKVNHHDMGFLYSLSCVAGYKLTGNEDAKKAAILAADNLASRYREVGHFLQAWGNIDDPAEYRLIIDCLLNLPILYWATEATGDKSYAMKAENHIETAMKCVLRPDNSTYHTHYIDLKTGEPTTGVTKQGNRDGSAWARGQSWGVYGTALSYKYLKNPDYIEDFRKVTDYFIEHLPEDLVPYWDFDFDTGSTEPRDSSAAAITICGILEMSKYLEKEEAEKYTLIARKMMKALIDNCQNKDYLTCNGILKHGVYCRKSEHNPCRDRGVDECNTWGDYFFMEALMRLINEDWKMYW